MSELIPFRLRVGVVGHRQVPDDAALAQQVNAALQRLCRLVLTSDVTPLYLTVVSSLAEGADQLVACAALHDPGNVLEVVLPLPHDDYRAEFTTAESRRSFEDLLARADSVAVVAPAATREEAYQRAGHDVAERCDVLLALWDGRPARAVDSTSGVVDFARLHHIPLIWIETAPPFDRHEEHLTDQLAVEFKRLDAYNRHTIDDAAAATAAQRQSADLVSTAERVGLPAAVLQPFCDWLLPAYVRADTLAQRYQRRFLVYGAAVFLLAAAATVTIAFQRQFLPHYPLVALVEVLFIVVNWAIVFAGRDTGHVQQRWLDYRALAERLRSRLFVALIEDADRGRSDIAPMVRHNAPEEWVERAFEEVWRHRPHVDLAAVPFEELKRFLVHAWLQDQISFMRTRNRTQAWRVRQLTRLANLAWGITVLVVVLHAINAQLAPRVSSLLIILAIGLPALAAALWAIADQREYARNAAHYERTARIVAIIARRMERVTAPADLRAMAVQAEAVLLEENRSWVFMAQFHELAMTRS